MMKLVGGFTPRYHIAQLLFYEAFSSIDEAIAAKKQIKGWVRKKKLTIIRTNNPWFDDLSKEWMEG